jgi:hypothetical protein
MFQQQQSRLYTMNLKILMTWFMVYTILRLIVVAEMELMGGVT